MKKQVTLAVLHLLLGLMTANAQAPTCQSNVPFWQVNLTGQPQGIVYIPLHSRQGDCCTDANCTSIEVTLDTGAAMIEMGFDIVNHPNQAIPSGSLRYQVNCGPQTLPGVPICISGVGPHYVTFCKPGNNPNAYYIRSIAKPTFPKPDSVRVGCSTPLVLLGIKDTTGDRPTWNSIFPGPPGAFNTWLSEAQGDTVIYTPQNSSVPFVDYLVCGNPIATICGYVAVCDTVRVYNFEQLVPSAFPQVGQFCTGGPGVTFTGSATGGIAPYSFIWRNSSLSTVSTTNTFSTTIGGSYSLEIRDILYDATYCPSTPIPITAIAVPPPVVNAGPDQTLCVGTLAVLNGSVSNAVSGQWTGGAGTFTPNDTSLLAGYTPTPAEYAAGQVTLTLTSRFAGAGCSNVADQITLFFPTAPQVTVLDIQVNCFGATGTLGSVTSGGAGTLTFSWSNGATTSSVLAGEGTYCLTVVDTLGCIASDCGNITQPSPLTISMSSNDVMLNGGNDGSASTIVSGGTGPYSYNWSPGNPTGDGTPTISGLVFGVYTAVVTDANGCTINSSVVVNEPRCNTFQASASSTNVTCFGGANGTATATPINGVGPFNFQWNSNPVQNNPVATNLNAGVYQVTVSDLSNGCVHIVNVTITQPTQLYATTTQNNVTVIGGNNGSATVNPFDGAPPYTFLWSNGQTTQTINNLVAGTYSVTVTDLNGCATTNSVVINEPPCNNLTAAVYPTTVTCNGGSDGSASVNVLFSNNPLTYLWSNGATTPTISNLPAGAYSVTVTDSLNCQTFVQFTITEPSPLSINAAASNITCFGYQNGTLELFVSGGTFPYTYVWSNGLAVQDQIDLGAGTYSVIVTDANGCTASTTGIITEPSLILAIPTITNALCNGDNNGVIDLQVSGGNGGYTYLWSNGQTTQDLSNLMSGLYSVTITDINGCIESSPFTYYVPQPSVVTATATLDCPIPGSGQALVHVTPDGGNSINNYQVSFDNGSTFQPVGSYSILLPTDSAYQIQVTDSLGCTLPISLPIGINPEVEISSINFNPCIGDNVTSIPVTVNVTGGNGGPISISTNGGITYLAPGVNTVNLTTGNTYIIIARDSSNCTSSTDTVFIPNKIVLSGTIASYAGGVNVTCFGANDGSIDLSVVGGFGTYTYAWSNSSVTQDVTNLTAGTYYVVVTDANACKDTIAFTLLEPVILESSIVSTGSFNGFDVSCWRSTDGGIDVQTTGGTPGYTYVWNTGDVSEDLANIGAGVYTVIATDANGCQFDTTITLTEPPVLALNENHINIPCNGFTTGSIDLTINGGVIPYTYLWSNNASTQDIDTLGAGTYNVVITDANGCTIDSAITISENSPIVALTSSTNLLCFGDGSGAIQMTITGATPPYNILWSNGSVIEDQTGLSAGVYSVLVNDSNNCVFADTFVVAEPPQLTMSSSPLTYTNGYNVSAHQATDGAIDVTAAGGTAPLTFSWSGGQTSEDLIGIGAGTYLVTVIDANGCTTSDSVTLREPVDIDMPTGFSPNMDGKNDAFVIEGLDAFKDNKLEIYNRWGNLVYDAVNYNNQWRGTSNTGENLPDGTYFVILNVNNGQIILTGFVDLRRQ
jgi:gliding motility-associated-like protein